MCSPRFLIALSLSIHSSHFCVSCDENRRSIRQFLKRQVPFLKLNMQSKFLLLATLSAFNPFTMGDELPYFLLSERNLLPRQGGDAFIPATETTYNCPLQNQCGSRYCVYPDQGDQCCSEDCWFHLTDKFSRHVTRTNFYKYRCADVKT